MEQLSAYLWTTQQLDAFRKAATDYGDRLRAAAPSPPLPIRRLGIAVVGQGVTTYEAPLFRDLRPHGAYFANVKPETGLSLLLKAVEARAKAHPVPYGHWYIDGGLPADHSPLITSVSYQNLEPVRTALLNNIQSQIQKPGMGPEELRTHLASLVPSDLGMNNAGDQILDRFPGQSAHRRFRNPDLLNHLRAVDGPRSVATRPAAHYSGALRPPPAPAAHERAFEQ